MSLRQLYFNNLRDFTYPLQDHTMPVKYRCDNRRLLQKKLLSCSHLRQVQACGVDRARCPAVQESSVRVARSQGKAMKAAFWSVCTCSALSMLEPVTCFWFFNRASVEGRRHVMMYTKLVVITLLLRRVFTPCITPQGVRLCKVWIRRAKLSPY